MTVIFAYTHDGKPASITVRDDEKLERIEKILCKIHEDLLSLGAKIMASLDDVAKDISDESTLIDGVSTLITGLQQQIADALSGATLPPTVQAKVDAVFQQAEANKAKLTAALGANTGTPPAVVNAPPVS